VQTRRLYRQEARHHQGETVTGEGLVLLRRSSEMQADFSEFMGRLCKSGAAAVAKYVTISGLEARRMPEYYLVSALFSDLGSGRAITLETQVFELQKWLSEPPTELVGDERSG
jgi:hypothetical protein